MNRFKKVLEKKPIIKERIKMKKINKILNITLLSITATCILPAYDAYRGLSIGASSKNTSVQTGKKEALIVGVSNYASDDEDLKGIDKDIAKMKQLFTSWGFDVKILQDADSMNILNYLNQYAKNLNSNDSFAFYYSGHGSHKTDNNSDESDGEDETLVLSDGKVNKHLIDDILYKKFNDIKAKKMVFFDSCHSGTAFRSLENSVQIKTIQPKNITESFEDKSTRGLSIGGTTVSKKEADHINSGNFVVFSSSKDAEESLSTPSGSLFTNALFDVFSDRNLKNDPLNKINERLVEKVLAYAKRTDGTPHHPTINYSSLSIGTKSLENFISIKAKGASAVTTTDESTLEETFEAMIGSNKFQKMSINYQSTVYNTGNSIEFEIDTKQDRGYLSVFYVDKNDVTILYPNPFVNSRELQGKYKFPQDLANGQFELEAYKNCTGCKEEKTTIYTLLSAEPISNIKRIQSKGLTSFGNMSEESKKMSRAIKIKATAKSNSSFKPQLGKYQFFVK